jgi:CBS domain-containing protein
MSTNLTLKDVMSKRVVTVAETKTVREAARLMNRHEIGSLVVTARARIIGIVTERDILQVVAKGKNTEKTRVLQVMSRPVIVGEEGHDLPSAIKVMVLHRIKKLPVVRGKKLVGIVTLTDFARVGPIVQEMMLKALEDVGTKDRKEATKMFKKFFADRKPPESFYA